MASESELRDALRSSAEITPTGIDTAEVVRKVRARRVPKQLAFTSVSVLAIAGLATLGIVTLPSLQLGLDVASESGVMATAPDSAADSSAGSTAKYFDAPQLGSNFCGTPTAPRESNSAGLFLSVRFPDSAPVTASHVTGIVILTNSGTLRVRGTTALAPIISLAHNGATVWHSNTLLDSQGVRIDLKPGESFSYEATFSPVKCEPEDDVAEQFRSDLPPLTPGRYAINAELYFIPDAAIPGERLLISGPAATISLR